MTVTYNLDVSHSSTRGFLGLMLKWRGSLWKAICRQLILWSIAYFTISVIYRFVLPYDAQTTFNYLAEYLSKGIDSYIPLTFMLGFFVSFVVGRWGSILNGIGWIDNAAMGFASYIKGGDEDTRMLRRTLVRYMVLTQALVLRDISLQVRKRFPSLILLEPAGLVTHEEIQILKKDNDKYGRYWAPLQWCYHLVVKARTDGKIPSDHLLGRIAAEIQNFQLGLATLIKYDWVPVPLVYPQLIFISVRIYFVLCLISRQFLRDDKFDIWIPVATMIQFIVFMGWVKVGEMLLNPLGDDDDDLECNHVIDKNLTAGFIIVERTEDKLPSLKKDIFWEQDQIAPLYTVKASKRFVHPLVGSAAGLNLLKDSTSVTMVPHGAVTANMDPAERRTYTRIINLEKPHDARTDPEAQGLVVARTHDE